MDNKEIVGAILSKDADKVAAAKQSLKDLLSAKAADFRAQSSKFVAQSLFAANDKAKGD